MKHILLFIVLGGFLLTGALLNATDVQQPAGAGIALEDYDEDEYGPYEHIIWEKPVKGVSFDHKVHTMEGGLDCDSCHDDLFEMEAGAAQEAEDFSMASLEEGSYCGACHDGSTAFASNTRCTTCHIGVRGQARVVGGDSGQAKANH
ncbi:MULTISPECIES: cytochrome c3 family protein [Desulfosediminicola]|uniref:cytochrome c3 family protein n=1 Tax=Desulfosediminicola TaxID=2886823 RepID=UPI0010AC33EC|nr:cytochrome c3 family protein [Desulfosediminicola ganghwensis]